MHVGTKALDFVLGQPLVVVLCPHADYLNILEAIGLPLIDII